MNFRYVFVVNKYFFIKLKANSFRILDETRYFLNLSK
jgi:hypothetical protein